MTPGVWKPKRWATPRTRAHRAPANGLMARDVLKETYPQARTAADGSQLELRRPDWARLAKKRRWMTWRQFWDTPKEWVPTKVTLESLVYANFPTFAKPEAPR